MTQYPEAWLARELELCYATVALVTDYDAGLEGNPDVPAVMYWFVPLKVAPPPIFPVVTPGLFCGVPLLES